MSEQTTHPSSKLGIAARAYEATYEGPWGLKASEEDALLSVINALYPDFATGSDGIYAIRANSDLSEIAEWLYELTCGDEVGQADNPSEMIAAVLLPWLVEVLGEGQRSRPRRNAAGQKVVRIQSAKRDFAGPSYKLTVPTNIARLIGPDREFAIEVTDEGILYRAVSGEGSGLPQWIAQGE